MTNRLEGERNVTRCVYDNMGNRCTADRIQTPEGSMCFCSTHQTVPRFILVPVNGNPQDHAKHLRLCGYTASGYQRKGVIIGPTVAATKNFILPGRPIYEAYRREEAIMAYVKGEGIDLSHIMGREGIQ